MKNLTRWAAMGLASTSLAAACTVGGSGPDEALEPTGGTGDTATEPTDDELHAMDSDADGYSDLVELERGTDPHDAASVVYTGGWPAQRRSVLLEMQAQFDEQPTAESYMVSRFSLIDRHGEAVDIWDLSAAEKPVVFVLGASWTLPHVALHDCVGQVVGGTCSDGFEQHHQPLTGAVADGEVLFVSVLVEDDNGAPATSGDVAAFEDAHPIEGAVYLSDGPRLFAADVALQYYPTVLMTDARLLMTAFGTDQVLGEL